MKRAGRSRFGRVAARLLLSAIAFCAIIAGVQASEPALPAEIKLGAGKVQAETREISGEGLPSNSVIDIEIFGSSLWAATGNGLGRFDPQAGSSDPTAGEWFSSNPSNGFGAGGVSGLALGVLDSGLESDTVVWAATAIDTIISRKSYVAGGGVGYSLDRGASWVWMPQPVDPVDAPNISPTTVSVQNVTYDIAILDNRVWLASWAGGLRYFDMTSERLAAGRDSVSWINRPPDEDPFGAVDHFNHRAFSLAVMDNLLWVGTAQGVNLSRDNGETWVNFRHVSNLETSLTGNFVPALGVQRTPDGRDIIWAATWAADGPTEYYGVSMSEDYGATWRRVLGGPEDGIHAHNFAFDGQTVYVATDLGLFKSVDLGETWGLFPRIYDAVTDETVYSSSIYSAAVGLDRLWSGGPDGLTVSSNGGNDWRLIRTIPPPIIDEDTGRRVGPIAYAYPNPFSPDGYQVVRFHYNMKNAGTVTLEIYDFAMELLIRPVRGEYRNAGENDELWDGLAPEGREIANGAYFYRILGGGEERWGKLLILH